MRGGGPAWTRLVFAAYAGVLFAATHYPRLRLPAAGRPDLAVHIVAFVIWTALLVLCGFFGPRFSGRNIALSVLVASVYSGVDEALQAIPFLHRFASWDDWAANLAGVAIAGGVAALVWLVRARRPSETGP